jgi:Ala-tRNA(Pro) deacylase
MDERKNKEKVLKVLDDLDIEYEIFSHPPLPTIEVALEYWKDIDATHCKNLFFRNHKGKKHYLVILKHVQKLAIHELEKRLKQGKLSLASDKRLKKYLDVQPGSVTPFGLINDEENHVHIFLDENLKESGKISFHPNVNTFSLVLSYKDFEKYLNWTGNSFEYLKLYD